MRPELSFGPPDTGPVCITISLEKAHLRALDRWRREQPQRPSRAAALIILAATGLTEPTGTEPGRE